MECTPEALGLETDLLTCLHSAKPVSGLTHNFYRYPARMSPDFARKIIQYFSQPGDVVLDPFMGGGTTIVESIACGRRSVGVDLNPLATFISTAKTTPLSASDARMLSEWVCSAPLGSQECPQIANSVTDVRAKNLPPMLVPPFNSAIHSIQSLPYPRQQRFARCALLRLGQWAVDCKNTIPNTSSMQEELIKIVAEMLSGLDELVRSAGTYGVRKHMLTSQRTILLRSSVGLENCRAANQSGSRPRLVLTSPPYPAVHVLYNRWQVQGRRETPAPYWFIGAQDGRGASYFTLGSRTSFGVNNYFRTITEAYRSVRSVIDPDARLVQLIAFSDVKSQLPSFLQAMEKAGFQEDPSITTSRADRWRTVPNRKWYYRVGATRGITQEVLLIHRPSQVS